MAISRQKKVELLELYKEQIENSSALVFTDYRGTSVPQIQSLRTKLTETDTTYMVVKNSIMSLALEQSGHEQPEEFLTGTKAVAFVGEDIGKGVSALLDWIKAEKIVEVRGAMVDSSIFDAEGAEALAELPTKEQTLAMILGTISAPAGKLVRILAAPAASLVRVLNAHVEQQNEAGAEVDALIWRCRRHCCSIDSIVYRLRKELRVLASHQSVDRYMSMNSTAKLRCEYVSFYRDDLGNLEAECSIWRIKYNG